MLEMGDARVRPDRRAGAIAEPDVGVITNIGPVHLEQIGSLEGVARAKAELLAAVGGAVVPADEPLLDPYLRDGLNVIRFGDGRRRRGLRSAASDDRRARRAAVELELPFTGAPAHRTRSPRWPPRTRSASRPAGAWTSPVGALRGERVALPAGVTVINDCYNANPLSMRAALDDLRPTTGRRPALAVLGDMLELGRAGGRAAPRDRGPRGHRRGRPARHGRAARAAMLACFDGESLRGRRRRRSRRAGRRADRTRRRRAGEGLARDRPRGRRGGARRMGEVLIAGTASLLICVFLSPKFIEFLRRGSSASRSARTARRSHHAKAGTPTMGGIIIFTAIAVPFLLLTDFDARSLGVFGVAVACALLGFADDYTKLVKRRSLGLRGRTKLIVTILISIGLWLVATEGAGLRDTLNLRIVDAQIDLGYLYPVLIYFVVAGTTTAVNLTDGLDGLAAGCAAIVLLAYIAITFTTGQRTSRSSPAAWSARASGSSGSTRSRRRSSWATPARWVSAARSRRWR